MDLATKCLLLVLLTTMEATKIFLTDTPIQRIGSRIYKKELLTDKYSGPKELSYDSATRTLYFMYMDDIIQNSGRALINILTKKSTKIDGIRNNKATAVDTESGDVYFGSENGLYKYDPITNTATSIGFYNVNIMKLVIRNNAIYVLDANNHMVYKIINDVMAVKAGNMKTVMEFEVDNQRNIHYVSMCGVYCVVEGHVTVKNTDLSHAYHFIVDDERTFAVTADGLYEVQCSNGTAKRVADLDFFPTSIIFGDYGDIFYTLDNSIYRLKPVTSHFVYYLRTRNRN